MDNAVSGATCAPARVIRNLPFDLQAAQNNAPIALANGRTAEFIAFCERAIFPLVVLVGPNNTIATYRADGTTPDGDEYAIVMVVPVETRYVNLFADGKGAIRGSGEHYATADEAVAQSVRWIESGGTPMLAIAAPIEVRVP